MSFATAATFYPFASEQMVRSPRLVRVLAALLLCGLGGTTAGMALLPWQQTSKGTGRVVAYHPNERPQTVESPIYGRVVKWGKGIVEGARVKQGDVILEIRDNDPGRADRLVLEVQATREKVRQAENKAETYGRQIKDLVEAKEQVLKAYDQLVAEAQRKVAAEQQGLVAAQAAVDQTKRNYERQKRLFEGGLNSGTSFEKDRRSHQEAEAKSSAANEYWEASQNYVQSKVAERSKNVLEAQTKVDKAIADQQEALGEVALARKELLQAEGKQAQFQSRTVLAPRDGVILRLFANDNAEMLKEGDPLFTIVPETTDRAVELWVDGNDIPLVTLHREVRLQFEGWPAVQFAAGWPRAAMGTFAGKVTAIDATDNGKGKFRVLIRPEKSSDWPEERFLRQGVRANGWVLLNEVALGYELWRQLNGFPPVYGDDKDAEEAGGKEAKKIKLPK
jgi:membrane fusion protein, adhesin transport system